MPRTLAGAPPATIVDDLLAAAIEANDHRQFAECGRLLDHIRCALVMGFVRTQEFPPAACYLSGEYFGRRFTIAPTVPGSPSLGISFSTYDATTGAHCDTANF